jgi:hypothetical protein
VALAREDRSMADVAAAVLERLINPDQVPEWYRLFVAYRQDDPYEILDAAPEIWTFNTPYPEILMFLSERGVHAPPGLLEPATLEAEAEQIAFPIHCARIAAALGAEDAGRLAAAIDDAEAHEMAPHAARMRIVLAQRTGDRAQLDRARPILERLGDRQFLRRLAEVAATLPSSAPAPAPTTSSIRRTRRPAQ